ncbi:alpha/beta hydrolase family protein [Ferruginibacter yonginensis]|uniref:Alpha/beta hydrolase family protein n=1 Tax=Ferruginibacter yonginensis TaxID=1310416 RepID=A0ABV8QUA5_9BACT
MKRMQWIVKCTIFLMIVLVSYNASAQDAVGYKQPPKEIADLLLAKPTPSISVDEKAVWMLISERNSYPTVEELGQPELRIAGLRLNPNNYSPSRQSYINNFTLKNIKTNATFTITGLPKNLLASNVSWNSSQTKIAFTNTTNSSIDAYIIDVAAHKATKVNKRPLNLVSGEGLFWFDDNAVMYQVAVAPVSKAPKKPITPNGPTVQQNIGKAAPGRTYQDMIKTPYDEAIFEFLATSQLVRNNNGIETNIGAPAIFNSIDVSPDKKYILTETIHKPFSYVVPSSDFPSTVSVLDAEGKLVKVVAELPSSETRPSGSDNVQDISRGFNWRADKPATIIYSKPLDGGLMANKMEFHDAVYALEAPFKSDAKELFKTNMRFRGVTWGNETFAWVSEGLTGKQVTRVSRYNPTTNTVEKLFERNTTDAYANPGSPITEKNSFGRNVIKVMNNTLLMNNPVGSSPKGDLPFLAKFDLATKQSTILWRCGDDNYEYVVDVVDADNLVLLTRKEAQKEVPNYYIKNLKLRMADVAITNFSNPYPSLDGVTKQKVKYKRADGVDLTGDLYLPKGYDAAKQGPLPLLIWAYPREFNSAADAAQIRGSSNRFTTINWASPIFYVTQGFAILDNAEMPIVSTDSTKKPNDNFIDQLKMNASAAISTLAAMGVADSNRVAVGGHSYGAFMTANLLAHTKLFKAGIARSGAYNRTLTPFGFQNEDRTYWQAPQLYNEMSPFSYADKIKTPLLLIHGDSDDNQGTFPINSERLYAAIKGNGGTVRFVFLPYEAHSYRGKENLLHMLWEQNEWLIKFVKNAGK